jgi:hypothetical protein
MSMGIVCSDIDQRTSDERRITLRPKSDIHRSFPLFDPSQEELVGEHLLEKLLSSKLRKRDGDVRNDLAVFQEFLDALGTRDPK